MLTDRVVQQNTYLKILTVMFRGCSATFNRQWFSRKI